MTEKKDKKTKQQQTPHAQTEKHKPFFGDNKIEQPKPWPAYSNRHGKKMSGKIN